MQGDNERASRIDSVTASLALAGLAAVLYAAAWPVVGYDTKIYLLPWYEHVVAAGQVGAFAEPFSNYAPPYLYLLALASLLDPWVGPVGALKIIGVVESIALAAAAYYLLRTLQAPRALVGAATVLVLPTVIINGPILAQCDALWVAPCLVAIAEAKRQRTLRMLLWFGLAGAIKLQAVFMSPFAIGVLIRHRAPPWLVLVPLLVYAVMAVPAALAGWPLLDLATVYVRQVQWGENFISNAPSPWTLGQYAPELARALFPIGYAAAIGVALWLVRAVVTGRVDLLRGALISATALPYVLPKMHERYFFAADLLALIFAWAVRTRGAVAVAMLTVVGSLAAIVGHARDDPRVILGGAAIMGLSLLLLLRRSGPDHSVVSPFHSSS